MAKGLDIGTCFLVGAHQDPTGMSDGTIKSIRDAFLTLEGDQVASARNMLRMSKAQYIEEGDRIFILGDHALNLANLLKQELQRPLSQGIISPGERDAEKILYLLIKEVLGNPSAAGEKVFYSVPAAPIDSTMDVTYHAAMFKSIVENFGYTAYPMNEAAAVGYSELSDTMFTGVASSFGAGMTNTVVMYQTMLGMEYSISKGGDFIDQGSARAVGKTSAQMMSIKEKGINLLDLNDGDPRYYNERRAISVYYQSLITETIQAVRSQFRPGAGGFELSEAVPWVISGGTSKAKGFLELFQKEFEKIKDFPIEISEFRMASDPLNAVAKGLLVAAINDEES